jgi:hypothetical protein
VGHAIRVPVTRHYPTSDLPNRSCSPPLRTGEPSLYTDCPLADFQADSIGTDRTRLRGPRDRLPLPIPIPPRQTPNPPPNHGRLGDCFARGEGERRRGPELISRILRPSVGSTTEKLAALPPLCCNPGHQGETL